MRASHVLIAQSGVRSTPPEESESAASSFARESDQLVQALTGPGYLWSCGLAVGPAILAFGELGADSSPWLKWAAIALILATVIALVHRRNIRSSLLDARALGWLLVRHRLVLLFLGTACTWCAWEWLELLHDDAGFFVLAFLALQCGFGGAAAATDRLAFLGWLFAVALLPGLLVLVVGDGSSRYLALYLLVTAAVVYASAIRIRELVARAVRACHVNDRLVAQLRGQVTLVEAANAEKSRFLGAASHDLRQPMHALGLFAAALEKELRGTPQHPKVISMARAVDALEDSFGAMLDVSRLDAGIVQPNLQSFPIRDIFRRLHMHCAGHAEERRLSLRFKAGGKVVTSDPQLLERILGNLVNNALRYTESGGVVVVARTRANFTSLEVWDTGVGIAAEELPNIFKEFYQVGNAARDRTRGLGMGLSIVARLVLLLGHKLEVKSTPGRGTVFRLLLQETELADMSSMVLGADTIPSAPDEDRTILFIDDEDAVRSGMKELLEGWGFRVLLAASAAEACQVVRHHQGVIDMVVSDLRLGADEDGIRAIADVREQYGAPLPALLITGDTSPSEVKRAHDSGHPVLFKPVRTRDLFAALRRVPK